MKIIKDILNFELIALDAFKLTVSQVLLFILILIITKVILMVVRRAVMRGKRLQELEVGNREAIFQIIRYFVWVIAIILALESIGIEANVLLAGSAALLVGIGLGLQQLFNDIVSGIILLAEGSVRVGDILEIDGEVVRVESMNLRTSKVVDRDDIIIIMPNHKMVNEKVINWNHQIKETRFKVSVGVAYGSDVDLVLDILEQSAAEHPECSLEHKPMARLVNFGESSLDFDLFFWSKEMFRIEGTLSDIRRTISKKFAENGVTIPFPQRDVHMKSK